MSETSNEPKTWVIYSAEHGGWWGPNSGGYFTNLVGGAGLYTEAEAKEIERTCHGRDIAEPLSKYADKIDLYYRRVIELKNALTPAEPSNWFDRQAKRAAEDIKQLPSWLRSSTPAEPSPAPCVWQPIESAPKVHPLNGGEDLLLAWEVPGIGEWVVVVGCWRGGWFSGVDKAYPTLWARIPPLVLPPAQEN